MTDSLDRTPPEKRRRRLVALLLALLLMGAGAAVYTVTTTVLGTPAPSASAAPSLAVAGDKGAHLRLTAGRSGHFVITGNLTASLDLGLSQAEPLDLLITNRHGRPLTVTDIRVRLSAVRRRVGAQGTCVQTGPDSPNFAVSNLPSSYRVTVPAHSVRGLVSLGTGQEPAITWLDQAWAQNGCLGATLNFNYAADGWYR